MTIHRWALITFSAAFVAGLATWSLEPGQAQDNVAAVHDERAQMMFGPPSPVKTAFVRFQTDPAASSAGSEPVQDQSMNELDQLVASAATETLPVEQLSIVSQAVRRAGLGSRAMATLVLRNGNAYPVKDIEVRCAFSRPDGRVSTERVRTIDRTLKAKSRESLPPTLVGFVSIAASVGKCSLVSASRA